MSPSLLALLMLAVLVGPGWALRCADDWQCGVGGVCDRLLACCSVRGCPVGCPRGQACVAIGYPRCGKFSKLVDTCACPRKHGCVPLRSVVGDLLLRQPAPPAQDAAAAAHAQQLHKSVYAITQQIIKAPLPRLIETPLLETQQQRPEMAPEPEPASVDVEDPTEEPRPWLDIFYDLQ